jgi:NDP-sugar pyrophosphorylase family protein
VFYDFSLQKLMLDYFEDGKNKIHCFEGQAIYYQTNNKDACIDVLHNQSSIQSWSREEITLGQVYLLDSPKVFFELSMRLLNNKLTHFSVDYFQQGSQFVKGTNVAVNDSSLNQRMAYLGDNTSIHSSSKLRGEVVLCQDVLVDKNTTIEDSIVFPNTYLGRNLMIKKAIVLNNKVLFLDQDELIDLSDKAMIAPLRKKMRRTNYWV